MQKNLAGICLRNWAVYGHFHLNTTFQSKIANHNVFTWLSFSLKCNCSLKLWQPNCIHLAFLVSVYKLQLGQMVSFSAGGALVERNSSWSKINALIQQQFNCREKLWFWTSVWTAVGICQNCLGGMVGPRQWGNGLDGPRKALLRKLSKGVADLQGWATEWVTGCVNPASWFPP